MKHEAVTEKGKGKQTHLICLVGDVGGILHGAERAVLGLETEIKWKTRRCCVEQRTSAGEYRPRSQSAIIG